MKCNTNNTTRLLNTVGIGQYDINLNGSVIAWVYRTQTTPHKLRCFVNDTLHNQHGEITDPIAMKAITDKCTKKTLLTLHQDSAYAFKLFEKYQNVYTVLV